MSAPALASGQSGFGGRGYRIPGRLDRFGRQMVYPSVTTVLKQSAKPALLQWVADQTAAWAVANRGRLNDMADDIGWSFLRFYWSREPALVGSELRQHHEGIRDDAAELGTNVHEILEAEVHGLPAPEPIGREVEQMLDAWDGWLDRHAITPHHAEFTVVNDWGYGFQPYAGTGDHDWTIRCEHDGPPCLGTDAPVRTLIDVKSSRYTWREHGMQLTALFDAPITMVPVPEGTPGAARHEKTEGGRKIRTWWTERESPAYDRIALLHIRPRDLTPKGDPIPAFCELVDRTRDLDLYRRGFQGALLLASSAHDLAARGDRRALEGL